MKALKELLLKTADDAFILGHRNSEWTGLGPTLEEDIAFSSMAQDKIGHALNLYKILHEELGEVDPDKMVYGRPEGEFKCCHLVEIYSDDYAYALVRHFLFDHADYLRYQALGNSSFKPLADISGKVKGEIKYHIMHGDTWVRKLAAGTEESKARIQSALKEVYPLALGIFEEGEGEQELIDQKIFIGEKALKQQWLDTVVPFLESCELAVPKDAEPVYGGRKGYHSEDLKPLLEEMREVFASDPEAEW